MVDEKEVVVVVPQTICVTESVPEPRLSRDELWDVEQ
jgi:hypothetical protein